MIVEKPRLIQQSRTLDFGSGFYTTTNLEQAVSFAEKVAARRRVGTPCVSVYAVPEVASLMASLLVRVFAAADEAWLDFVFENRSGSYLGPKYDIVLGPVANDTIYRTFAAYEDGILTKEETVSRLKVKKLYNQMTFSTEKALETLRFVGTLDGEEANHE